MCEWKCTCGKKCKSEWTFCGACGANKPAKIKLPSRREVQMRHIIFKSMKGSFKRGRVVSIINYIGKDTPGVYTHYPPKPSTPTNDGNICKICMDEIPKGKRALIWCFHPFCKGCLEHWYTLKNECPTCRAPFCISCGANPKEDLKNDNACRCPLRTAHKNAATCNLCGEWAPEHGPEINCPRFRNIHQRRIRTFQTFRELKSPAADDDLPELEDEDEEMENGEVIDINGIFDETQLSTIGLRIFAELLESKQR